MNQDFLEVQKIVYTPHGLLCNNITQEAESQEYGACTFEIHNKKVVFRTAKITPTKIGQFVTLWKRSKSGPIIPYDAADSVDFFVVSIRHDEHFGQFVFPKEVLLQKGFVSKNGAGGKRAMRVYPAWDIADNAQAKKTQAWQLIYFFEIKPNVDNAKVKRLFYSCF